MLVSSDSWIALPGNISQTQREYQALVHHGQLSGVPLCQSHFLGLQSWYWTQAVALAQMQRSMAEDQWMPDPQTMEVSCLLFRLFPAGEPLPLCVERRPRALPLMPLYAAHFFLSYLSFPVDEVSLLTCRSRPEAPTLGSKKARQTSTQTQRPFL